MDSEQHGQEQRAVPSVGAVPPPPPRQPPALPPRPPASSGAAVHPLVTWLRLPRPAAGPGIWRAGYEPRPADEPDRVPTRQLLVGAGVSALVGWLVWSVLWNGYLGTWWIWPLLLITPDGAFQSTFFVIASWVYYAVVAGALAVAFGRLGGWPELWRRARAAVRQANAKATAAEEAPPAPAPESDPALWPQLRADGAVAMAETLSAELREGRMTDVDYARIDHAWRTGRARAEITEEVRARGAAACVHGSGARDLPARAARHDLPLRQVRIGSAVDSPRNPYVYRGAGIALAPAVLGTSMLVVGPSGREPAEGIVRPVVESLCLQALAGQAAVIAVTSAGSAAPSPRAYDVVLRAGDPSMAHSLDLYAGLDDADEAAGVLAEALVGDLAEVGRDDRSATTALAQLLGPWRAVHGQFPGIAELRDLLDDEDARAALRAELEERDATAHLRELDRYERRSGAPGGPVEVLSARVALLDRPAFHAFLVAPKGGTADDRPAFSLQHVDRPVRVRIDLPERVHTDASRIIARLVLAQFTAWATSRRDQSVFAFLALEDAVQVVTQNSLRGLQGVRRSNAGVLVSLRSLSDIPEGLRDHLLAAVGCRVACVGVSSWDAQYFATAWGTEWVETEMVTHRQVRAEHPGTKVWHMVRKMVTGQHVTTKSVTMRREERQRWSSSELANDLQTGHAVISLTTVTGERMPPILTKLSG